ncbi:hypothetical protein F2Q68_00035899 [Brassica cretica]|uniref:Uncharacterized protein n=1 Tax=Brassica cretica TaxID=69181 RepID=A0A8S9GXI0_BRACR|nr:hypothetical protein F2Q68_00035899 [Brassica cretica]
MIISNCCQPLPTAKAAFAGGSRETSHTLNQRCRWRYDGGVAVCGEQNMPIVLQKFQYKEVGVLGLPMKVSVEEGALVSGAGLFSLWSFVLGVLVLAWYRERWVQVCLVLCVLCWPPLRLLSLCLVGSWQECRQF